MRRYRSPGTGKPFKFPFRLGSTRSQATGHYNTPAPGRPSKSMPSVKQFTRIRPGRPKQRDK